LSADKDRGASPFGAFVRRPTPKSEGAGGSASVSVSDADVASVTESQDVLANVSTDALPQAAAVSAAHSDQMPDDLIEVGAIAQAYGVRGQVKVLPHANVGDALVAAPYWWLAKSATGRGGPVGTKRRVKVLGARHHSGSVAAALSGSTDRDAAEALRGSTVWVRRADFPKLDDGEYYWVDLIGLDVFNPSGTTLGRVVDLMDNGAHSVLRVGFDVTDAAGHVTQDERLIPFVDAYLRDVDLTAKKIVVDWDVDY